MCHDSRDAASASYGESTFFSPSKTQKPSKFNTIPLCDSEREQAEGCARIAHFLPFPLVVGHDFHGPL